MTENRYMAVGTISEIMPAHKKSKCIKTLCREINACTRISQNTLLRADCLQRSSCPCQERVALFLLTEIRAVGFNHRLNRFQGPKWLGGRARDVLLRSLRMSGPS